MKGSLKRRLDRLARSYDPVRIFVIKDEAELQTHYGYSGRDKLPPNSLVVHTRVDLGDRAR